MQQHFRTADARVFGCGFLFGCPSRQPYSTHTLPALRDWLCQLSWDAAAARDASDERASPATVDEQAVEAAQRVAEWRDVEVDKVVSRQSLPSCALCFGVAGMLRRAQGAHARC